MTIGALIKKQVIDVLQWNGDSDEVLAWHYPMQDSEIGPGAVLLVRQSQMAIVVREGQRVHAVGPGKYNLSSVMSPFLSMPPGENASSLAACPPEVYFFNARRQIGRPWRTPQPLMIYDKDFDMIGLRASGTYSYRIADAKVFLAELGTGQQTVLCEQVEKFLHDILLATMANTLGCAALPFLELAANHALMAQQVRGDLATMFGKYGLGLDQFSVASISLPDPLQAALDARLSSDLTGGLGLDKLSGSAGVAASPSSPATTELREVRRAVSAQSTLPGGGMGEAAPAEAIGTRLEILKNLLDKGLISAADYDATKLALLKKLLDCA